MPLLLQPEPWCKWVGASQPVPPVSWSQIVQQTPGYGVTASSGGMTTPSTFVAGMAGYVAPPLGLTPPDFSSWSLPPPEALLPQGLPTALQGLPGVGRSIQIRVTTERHTQAQLAQGPRGLAQWAQTHPHRHHTHLRWHHLSISHHLASHQLHTNRRYSCQASPLGGESLSTPPSIKLKAWRTAGDRGLESGEMVADLPVTPGECKRRQVGRCLVRRVISPLGQHQTFPQPQHLREPRLSRAVGQGLCPMILHDWPPNTIAQDGKRTLSMCSRSTTSITPPPIRRQSG